MALHIISKSPFKHDAFVSAMRALSENDAVLLIEDGVYAAQNIAELSSAIIAAPTAVEFYALAADLQARGIQGLVNPAIAQVDDFDFVKLTENHTPCISWF